VKQRCLYTNIYIGELKSNTENGLVQGELQLR